MARLRLPTKVSVPVMDFMAYTLFLYGPPKIGKSSLFKHAEYFYFAFEKGLKALPVYKRYCGSWETFLTYIGLLETMIEEGRCPYKGIVVDTAEKMSNRCMDYTTKIGGVEHPADEEYGKGWERYKRELEKAVARLDALPIGKAYISHSQESKIIVGKKKERSRISPKLTGIGRAVILSQVDGIIYIGYSQADGESRILHLQGTELIEAGGRYSEVFKVPKSIPYRQSRDGHNYGLEDLKSKMIPIIKSVSTKRSIATRSSDEEE